MPIAREQNHGPEESTLGFKSKVRNNEVDAYATYIFMPNIVDFEFQRIYSPPTFKRRNLQAQIQHQSKKNEVHVRALIYELRVFPHLKLHRKPHPSIPLRISRSLRGFFVCVPMSPPT